MTTDTLFANIHFTPDEMEEKDLPISNYVLFAEKPWTANSKSEWVRLNDEGKVPREDIPEDMSEFLTGYALEECLLNIDDSPKELTQNEIVEAVIFFAENDFYPDSLDLDFG